MPSLSTNMPSLSTNAPIMYNYQNFMVNFRDLFRGSVRKVTATYQIHELQQGNRRVTLHVTEFRLIAAGLGWNKAALIAKFRVGQPNCF